MRLFGWRAVAFGVRKWDKNFSRFQLTFFRRVAYIRAFGVAVRSRRDWCRRKLLTGTVKQHPKFIGCVGLRRPYGLP